MRRALVLAVALVALTAPVVRADQQSRSTEAFYNDQSQLCRHALGTDIEECNRDGRDLSEARMAAYEGSWVHEAIALQRALDHDAPLTESLLPHTHNSYNSEAYTPSLSRMDNNQHLSLTDQLRLDMRAVEIDIHRTVSVEDGGIRVVACHARDDTGTVVHPGCTNEDPLVDYLVELDTWLAANPSEVVLLYLENALDDDLAAHDQAAADIAATIGDRVYTTPAECAPMPYAASRADILAAGAQVVIVGNCGAGGAWGGWVHDRFPRWDESGNPARNPQWTCPSPRPASWDTTMIRRYEDRTWLSAMAATEGGITVDEMRAMVDCGVNLVGFDMLYADDPRLETLVWSWAPNEPLESGDCALQGTDSRFTAADCAEQHRAACYDGGEWSVTTEAVTFAGAGAACGGTFDVPWNGWENRELFAAGGGDVWVAYADTGSGWEPQRAS